MRKFHVALITIGASLIFSSAAFADSQSRGYGGGRSRGGSTESLVIGAVAGAALGLAVSGNSHRNNRRGYNGGSYGYNGGHRRDYTYGGGHNGRNGGYGYGGGHGRKSYGHGGRSRRHGSRGRHGGGRRSSGH